jgi:hypothetical protein
VTIAVERILVLTPEPRRLLAERTGSSEPLTNPISATPFQSSSYSSPTFVSSPPGSTGMWRCGLFRRLRRSQRMYAREQARGRGLGKALIACIKVEARSAGKRVLLLETGPPDGGGGLYKR